MTAAVDTPRTRRKEQSNQEAGLWHNLCFPSLSRSYFFCCSEKEMRNRGHVTTRLLVGLYFWVPHSLPWLIALCSSISQTRTKWRRNDTGWGSRCQALIVSRFTSSQQCCGIGIIIIVPTLQTKTRKSRETQGLGQGRPAGVWQIHNLNPDLFNSEVHHV